jgi:hypothetical protein
MKHFPLFWQCQHNVWACISQRNHEVVFVRQDFTPWTFGDVQVGVQCPEEEYGEGCKTAHLLNSCVVYEGVSKSFETGRLERELPPLPLVLLLNECLLLLSISLSTQSGNFWIHPRIYRGNTGNLCFEQEWNCVHHFQFCSSQFLHTYLALLFIYYRYKAIIAYTN